MLLLQVHLKVVGLSYGRSEIKTLVEMLHTNFLIPLLGFVHFRVRIAWCHSKKSIYDYTSHLRSKTFPFIKRPVQQLLPLCPVTNWRLLHDEIIVFIEIFSVAVIWNFNRDFH